MVKRCFNILAAWDIIPLCCSIFPRWTCCSISCIISRWLKLNEFKVRFADVSHCLVKEFVYIVVEFSWICCNEQTHSVKIFNIHVRFRLVIEIICREGEVCVRNRDFLEWTCPVLLCTVRINKMRGKINCGKIFPRSVAKSDLRWFTWSDIVKEGNSVFVNDLSWFKILWVGD